MGDEMAKSGFVFTIGLTGHRDIHSGAVADIRAALKNELEALKIQLQSERDPAAREELILTAGKFAMALEGKKKKFISSYKKWKKSMLRMDVKKAKETRSKQGEGERIR